MKVTIVRHGKTEYNKLGKIQGLKNISLNDEGREQAKKLKEEIKDKHFDICFSSPLIRAMETAMILVGDKVQINLDDRLKERDMGDLEGIQKDTYDFKKYWNYELNCGDYNIEKIQNIFNRVNDFLGYLKENYNDKSILIVSHGATIKAMYHILVKTDLNSDLLSFDIDNCGKIELEINN